MLLSEHEVSKSWHPSKNTLALTDLTTQSGRRVWWICSNGHEWECRIADRVQAKNKAGTDCPYCAGRKVWMGFNDIASQFPMVASEWHLEKNIITPEQVYFGSRTKFWWICSKEHIWKTSVCNRTSKRSKTGCPYCAGNLIWIGFNDLASQKPDLAFEWHPTKNGEVTPQEVSTGTTRKFWWLGACSHEWEASISSRVKTFPAGCPVCNGKQVLAGFNDLESKQPKLMETWHPTKNKSINPNAIHMASRVKVWWQCDLGHEWELAIANRVSSRNGTQKHTGCPTCYGIKILPGFNDLASQYPSIASEWHPTKNGEKEPHTVYAGGKKRYWWQCAKHHDWETEVESRIRGRNCPTCAIALMTSKGESEIAEFLINNGYRVEQSNRSVFKNKRELDIYLSDNQLAIEFNGLYYHSEEMGKDDKYHRNKWIACSEKEIDLIQVWEDDWNSDPAKIKRLLLKSLNTSTDLFLDYFTVEPCPPDEVFEFIRANTFTGDVDKSEMNFKCLDKAGSPVAVLALSLAGKDCQIVGYADNLPFISSQVLTHMLSTIDLDVSTYFVHTDNCTNEHKVFMSAGFQKIAEIKPYPSIMKRNRRVSLERTPDGFTYLDKKGEVHLAPSKKLIWDAGKTTFSR